MSSYTSKIQSQVLSLAWHPTRENLLAFGTREGRVGLLDTTRTNYAPIILKPCFGRNVYTLSWAKMSFGADDFQYALFCCGHAKLVYYKEVAKLKFEPIECSQFKNVTCVSGLGSQLAVGFYDGEIHLCDLNSTLKTVQTIKVSSKLISGFAWKNNLLAIAAFDKNAYIYKCDDKDSEVKTLCGHDAGITSILWHRTLDNILITASLDATVKVWDVDSASILVSHKFHNEMFVANIIPIADTTLIVGGQETPLTIYDYLKEFELSELEYTRSALLQGVEMPEKSFELVQNFRTKEKKNNSKKNIKSKARKLEKEDGSENVSELKTNETLKKNVQLNYTTFLSLTNRELNRRALEILNDLLSHPSTETSSSHEKLFGTEEQLKQVLRMEHDNLQATGTVSVGHTVLPLLMGDLKDYILDRIASQTLTEEQVALSPSIGYTFWRQSCKAFAQQCVARGQTLKAISYFLSCGEIEDCVKSLCEADQYREAYAVAKLYFDNDEPLLRKVVQDWIKYLEMCGNYEGAALIWAVLKKHKEALDVLSKRLDPNENVLQIIQKLKEIVD